MLTVVPVNVIHPNAAACVASTWSVYVFTLPVIKARAQHARAADGRNRRFFNDCGQVTLSRFHAWSGRR